MASGEAISAAAVEAIGFRKHFKELNDPRVRGAKVRAVAVDQA